MYILTGRRNDLEMLSPRLRGQSGRPAPGSSRSAGQRPNDCAASRGAWVGEKSWYAAVASPDSATQELGSFHDDGRQLNVISSVLSGETGSLKGFVIAQPGDAAISCPSTWWQHDAAAGQQDYMIQVLEMGANLQSPQARRGARRDHPVRLWALHARSCGRPRIPTSGASAWAPRLSRSHQCNRWCRNFGACCSTTRPAAGSPSGSLGSPTFPTKPI